ncbi:hypothetical protein E1176_03305 [Fulvivirga sp. RKSG066]|nr:hypothetical protein [Fulvivirga aurantia]
MKEPTAPGNISGLEAKLIVLLGLSSYTLVDSDKSRAYTKNSFLGHFEENEVSLLKSRKSKKKKQEPSQRNRENVDYINDAIIESYFDYIDVDEVSIDYTDTTANDKLLRKLNLFQKGELTEEFLRAGLELENYQVGKPKDSKDYIVAYNSDSESQWAEMGHFDSLEDASKAAILLTRFLRDMNLSSEGLHLMEHVLLRPQVSQKKFGIYLLDQDGNRVLRSAGLYDYEQRLKIIEQLKPHLSSYNNYSVEITDTKDFEIHFSSPDGKIKFVSVTANPSVEETHEQLEELFSYLSDAEVITPYEAKLDYYVRNTTDGPLVPESFYTYRITMLFPAWTARFSNPEFRSIAEEIIFQNQSASVASNILWLEIDKMGEFEKKYYQWLSYKREENADKEKLDEAADKLTRFLMDLV